MIFSENRFTLRIKSGAGFFGIMPYMACQSPEASNAALAR
jgi:hypothetical protein